MGKTLNKIGLIISDNHSGHHVGLTPPDWWNEIPKDNPRQKAICTVQRELWGWYASTIKSIRKEFGRPDFVLHAGDGIDGKGERSGGTEQKTADRLEQAEMAGNALNIIEAPAFYMAYGTGYHVGLTEDFEKTIRKHTKADHFEIGGHLFLNVNGCIVDLKHFIGNSSIPHGRFTALAKDKLWNDMWHKEHELQPESNLLIRGHVHEDKYCGSWSGGWMGLTCPALCGFGSKFGVRICSGTVSIGMIVAEFDSQGRYRLTPFLADLPHMKVRVSKV